MDASIPRINARRIKVYFGIQDAAIVQVIKKAIPADLFEQVLLIEESDVAVLDSVPSIDCVCGDRFYVCILQENCRADNQSLPLNVTTFPKTEAAVGVADVVHYALESFKPLAMAFGHRY